MARAEVKTITGRRLRQEQRRLRAAELFGAGRTRAEVAEELGVSWRAAHTWYQAWSKGGAGSLKATTKPGPAPKFSDEEAARVGVELRKGAMAHGYSSELWTLPRIKRLVEGMFHRRVSISETWRLMRRIGFSTQKPVRRARERDEEKIRQWKEQHWPRIKEKARTEGRTIVFVDESGLSQKPASKKTWAPQGQTPVLQMTFSWDKLSVIGGITLRSIYFQLHEESVKSEQVIAFLRHLRRHIDGQLLIVWDNLASHRSKEVAAFLASSQGRIWVERLPAYAPELNPIEYLWGYAKNNDLANLAPRELQELSTHARRAFRRVRRTPRCLRAFWIQTELDLNGM